MSQLEDIQAAWDAIKARQRQLHENLRTPEAAAPVERRVVDAGDSATPYRGPEAFLVCSFCGKAAQTDKREADRHQPTDGVTAKFGTGAVRSDTFEEFRYDLISPIGLREVARSCAEGAQKYSDFNWEKGMPVHDLLNHAIAHCYAFLSGDRSEPHLGHAAWNLLAAIHSHELWHELNEGHLRGPGCKAPDPTQAQ